MFFFTFHCIPYPGTSDAAEYGGAYINVWINEDDSSIAKGFAEKKIQETDWIILGELEAKELDSGFFSNDSKAHEYYQQALIDKWVIVMHTYPLEEET